MNDGPDTLAMGRRPGGEPEEGEQQVVDAALAEELVARAREQGGGLLGEHGLLRQMTKAGLERGLAEELTEHLGYEPHERAGTGNARNGTTPKQLHSEAGTIDLEVAPRSGGLLRAAAGAQGAAPPGRPGPDRHRPLRPRHDRP